MLIPAQPVRASAQPAASTLTVPLPDSVLDSTALLDLRKDVAESRKPRASRTTTRRLASHGGAAHMRAHTWLNNLHRAYRYAGTRERRIELGRAVRITKARILRDHAAAARRTWAAKARKAPRGMAAVVAYARAQVGKPYVFGASGPSGFDCSGLSAAAMRRIGVRLPHSSRAQAGYGRRVSKAARRAGDLMVWAEGHTAIYVGAGRMVDAPGRGRRVVERSIWGNPQYRRFA